MNTNTQLELAPSELVLLNGEKFAAPAGWPLGRKIGRRHQMLTLLFTLVIAFFVPVTVQAQQTWKIGDPVEAKYGGRWYDATILEVGRGQYKIRYDGYNSSWDEWKAVAELRPRANAARNVSNPAVTTTPSGVTGVNVGDWVLANKGTPNWYAATLLEVSQGEYKVRYHGDPQTSYFVVSADRIRPMPRQSVPATEAGFFFGKWELSVWGGVQTAERGGKTYREFDYAAAKVPPLVIKSDGTYEWLVAANGGRKLITGKWRNATGAEWRYSQVAIVLLNGMDGKNWIAYENITFCTPKFVGEKPGWCTPEKVRDAIKLWDGDINYSGSRIR